MSGVAHDLLSALADRDAVRFGAACRQIQGPSAAREDTWQELRRVFLQADVAQAQDAIYAIGFSGLASDKAFYLELVAAAEARFSAEELSKLVADYRAATGGPSKPLLRRLRLLQSTLLVAKRRPDAEGVAFVERVSAHLAESPAGGRIARWLAGGRL